MLKKETHETSEQENGLVVKLGSLGALVNFQLQFEKGLTPLKVRNTHLEKNGSPDSQTQDLLEESENFKKKFLLKPIADLLKKHPAFPFFSRVKGIGNENIAKVITFIDINEADSISALWKYAGYAVTNGVADHPTKGEKLSYNKELKNMCYRLGVAFLKAHSLSKNGTKLGHFFEKCLIEEKQKLEAQGKTVLPTEEWKKETKKSEHPENLCSEFYVHNRAFRRMVKLFLACLWMYWRKADNLPLRDPYSFEKQGHTTLIQPEELMDRELKVRRKRGQTVERKQAV